MGVRVVWGVCESLGSVVGREGTPHGTILIN